MKALIVIDVNKFFLNDAPDDFASKIADHIESSDYDLVVFPIFQNKPGSNFEKSLNWTKCSSEEDSALPEVLNKYAEHKFKRSTYSAFSETNLNELLKQNNIKELYLCGIDTDACVLATAFSGFDKGYKVYINFDLTFSSNDLDGEAQKIIERSITPQDKLND